MHSIVLSPAFVYGHGGGIPALWFESARDYGIVRYVGDGSQPLDHGARRRSRRPVPVRPDQRPGGIGLLWRSGQARASARRRAGRQRGAGIPGEVESVPYETARQSIGPLADLLTLDQQVSGEKAQRELGWRPAAPDLLTELRTGSYIKLRSTAGRA